mmetsp:Transcript_2987/g.10718  ORF Transcript_2987/g.10718 Transcript_2987/m.10718 type:complete len:183 (-) Transcript_2987:268-816(-)
MDIMMLLDGGSLTEVYDEFKRVEAATGEGLPLEKFVHTMTSHISDEKLDRERLVMDLSELFQQIDVNGDGRLEWEEFTGFCLEAGMMATRGMAEPLGFKYEHKATYHDTTTTGSFIEDVTFVPELRRVYVCEGDCATVREYDGQLKLLRELNTDAPFGPGDEPESTEQAAAAAAAAPWRCRS